MNSILAMQELQSPEGTDLEGVQVDSTFSASRCGRGGDISTLTWTRC